MNRKILLTGVILGVLSVVLGAFGAHGLEGLLSEASLKSYETGVKYQMYHALVLLWLGSAFNIPETEKRWPFYLFATGVVLFSFSIYLLALDSLSSINFKSIAFLTPIGGSFLIVGWILLGHRVLKRFG